MKVKGHTKHQEMIAKKLHGIETVPSNVARRMVNAAARVGGDFDLQIKEGISEIANICCESGDCPPDDSYTDRNCVDDDRCDYCWEKWLKEKLGLCSTPTEGGE